MTRTAVPGLMIALGVLIAGLLIAFTVGRYPVGLDELFKVIAAKITGGESGVPAAVESVILQVRGPRVIAAVLIGAALAVAGTAFQGLFRNPLVSPDILGASSGSARSSASSSHSASSASNCSPSPAGSARSRRSTASAPRCARATRSWCWC